VRSESEASKDGPQVPEPQPTASDRHPEITPETDLIPFPLVAG